MVNDINIKVVLASRPKGYPQECDFEIVESKIPAVGEGELLLKILWLSLDPYMRGRMNDMRSYAPSVVLGEPMVGGAVARVIESRSPMYKVGDVVEGNLGWQSYAISDGLGLRKVDESLAPLQTSLGVLGMPGLTAYFGFLDICKPIPGDTVVISAASGAVGQVVGQIAKIMGCNVVGTAGTDAKVSFIVEELGFNAGINYKTHNISDSLDAYCPDGVDVYFDNVGGDVTDAVLARINTWARIAICGQISQYNLKEPDMSPRNLSILTRSQAKMEGFLVFNYENRYEQGRNRLARWIKQGKIIYKESITDGLENAPSTFIGMLKGNNFGKTLIKVSESP